MIELHNITKRYGGKYAVRDISCTIKKGEILGFLGRNGAGKSTTMNIISGYISATSGDVLIDGVNILDEPRAAKRKIGYLPEQPPLYNDMTVQEYLRFACEIKEVKPAQIPAHVSELCELVKITDHKHRLIKNLSKGYRQRVGMAQALAGNPEIIIMDEPTAGLDPMQIIEINKLIRELGENHAIMLSSHILHEIADVCERVIIINKGEIVAQDTVWNLTNGAGNTTRLNVRIAGPGNVIGAAIGELSGLTELKVMPAQEEGCVDFALQSTQNTDLRRPLFELMSGLGYPILLLHPMAAELEDIFLQLTKDKEA
jgi:ABC-type multidrug transport system, ATPase component